MNEKTINNWIKISNYDFDTAESMLKAGRYLYVVFTCQQSIEKMLKAIYVKEKNETPLYTHNLLRLLDFLSIKAEITEENRFFLEELNSFYIESRYSEEIEKISKFITYEKAMQIFCNTKDIIIWLKKKV